MTKGQFRRQQSINEALDAVDNYEDEHYEEFSELLFNELLVHIQHVKFDSIIKNDLLTPGKIIHNTKETHSLMWLYRADRNVIDSITIYGFHFANACHPEFYQTFQTKAHHLFVRVRERRHRYFDWYECIDKNLPTQLDQYVNIERIVANKEPHETKLFIYQAKERVDIEFHFPAHKEQITICFESGYPAQN